MAEEITVFGDGLSREERRRLFNELTYANLNGTRREVSFPGSGGVVPVPHGLGAKPNTGSLTVRLHYAFDRVGFIWCPQDPDEQNVYPAAEYAGRAVIEISHPPVEAGRVK